MLTLLLAQAEPMFPWEHVLDKYGLPMFYLLLTLMGVSYFVKYLRDKVATPLVDSHNKLCENLGKNNDENTATLKEVGVNIKSLADKQDKTFKCVEQNGRDFVAAIREQTGQLLDKLKPSQNGDDSHTDSPIIKD